MAREITDKDTTWSLVQAYAGLKETPDDETVEAARVEGTNDSVHVIATPNGGAQTVRLQLKSDWEASLSDEELLAAVKSNQQ
jgi:hypothetical protein